MTAGQPEPQPQPHWGSDARDDDEPADRLRDGIADWLAANLFWGLDSGRKHQAADALIAGPLAPLLARLTRVEALADQLEGRWRLYDGPDAAEAIRRALDGP